MLNDLTLRNLLTNLAIVIKKIIFYLKIILQKKIYDYKFYVNLAHKLQNIYFLIILLNIHKSKESSKLYLLLHNLFYNIYILTTDNHEKKHKQRICFNIRKNPERNLH